MQKLSAAGQVQWSPRSRIPLTPIEREWPASRYSILREVLGPDFHGPSSSHTAAPQLIAVKAYLALGGVADVAEVTLFNSFALTGEGHKTAIAVTAGLLGITTTDPRTPEALAIGAERGFDVRFEKLEDEGEHPNTIVFRLRRGAEVLYLKAISIGGGNFRILVQQSGLAAAA